MPLAFFAAGCAVTYVATMRNHLRKDHLRAGYADGLYQGEYGDAAAIVEFAASRTWAALSWHLPDSAAAVGAAAFALALVGMALRRRFDAAGVSVALALAAAVSAAVLGLYPLGDTRPSVYLGPAAFIGFGFGINRAIDAAAAHGRGRRLSYALFAAAVAGLAIVAADDAYKTKPYSTNWNNEAAMSLLNKLARADDLVYASGGIAPNMEFYLVEKPGNYFFGTKRCADPLSGGCVPEIARAAREMGGAGRIWIAATKFDRLHKDLRNAISDREYVAGGDSGAKLFLIDDERDGALMTADGDAAENVNRRLAERFAETAAREPLIESVFDVYADGDSLIYAKEPCAPDDTLGRFYLQVAPVDERDLSDDARERGVPYDSFGFDFANEGSLFGGACLIRMRLPSYPIGAVAAGQWTEGAGELWSGAARFEASLGAFRDVYAAARATQPAARAVFDVYIMDGDSLIYAKEPCADADTRGRFLLSLFPADESDLREESRERGMAHNPRNFDFEMSGALFDGKCAARAALPDYPLAKIETGQWTPDGGEIWNERILFAAYFDGFRETLKGLSGRTPAVSSVFDVYADGDSLIYVKDPCADGDTRGRFLLSAFPADAADLTESARKSGLAHNSHNFDFDDFGAAFDGKCAIVFALPDYPIREIETGQWLPGEGEIWRATIAIGGR